jgi:putative membrane protein
MRRAAITHRFGLNWGNAMGRSGQRLNGVRAILAVGAVWLAMAVPLPSHAARVDDQAILSALVEANRFDIEMAAIAEKKALHKDVKALAEMILQDHAAIDLQAQALRSTLGWKEVSPGAAKVKFDRQKLLAGLKTAPFTQFDDVYLDGEDVFSRRFVLTLKTKWIPGAKQPQFKQWLMKLQGRLDAHLDHIKRLHSSAGSRAAH